MKAARIQAPLNRCPVMREQNHYEVGVDFVFRYASDDGEDIRSVDREITVTAGMQRVGAAKLLAWKNYTECCRF